MAAFEVSCSMYAGGPVGGWSNHRAASRTLVVATGVVYFQDQKHIGLIRDMSSQGLFVYSDFRPQLGESLRIVISDRTDRADKSVTCTGTVVRVEAKSAGAATGIALKITAFEL